MKQFLTCISLFSLLLIGVKKAYGQNYSSITRIANNSGMTIKSIAIDTAGNKFITGSFSTQLNFDQSFSLTSAGNSDIFIAKYNANDVLQWARRGGSTTADEAYSIAVDKEGSCYVTGSISGTANFSNTTGTVNAGSGTNLDVFIVKYNASGGVVWVKRYGGTGTEVGFSIAVDNDLNCYVSGSFSGATTIGTTSFTSNGSTDGFIAKFNNLGNGVWTKRIGSNGSDKITSVTIDSQGNVVFTGEFFGTVSVDAIALTSVGSIDIVVGKYATNGSIAWAKKIGSNSVEIAGAVKTDSLNDVYVCGYATGNTVFDALAANITNINNTTAAFISKFSNTGAAIWAQNNNGAGKNLVVSKDGFVVSVGSTTWAPTINNKTYASYGASDAVVNAVDYAGTYKWSRVGGSKFDDEWNGIATDANNNYFNVGDFRDTIILGNIVSNNSISNVNSGIIAKIGASGCSTPSIVRATSIQYVCEGSAIQLSTLVGAINMPEYTWQKNGNIIQTNNFNYSITSFSANDTGNYTFKVNYNCDSIILPITTLKLIPAYKCNAIPNWQWGASAGSNTYDIAIKHVTDKQRNTYVTGTFKNNMNFGSGNSITSAGGDDIFIVKYNANGLFQWAKRIGGTDLFDKPTDLEVDTKGNIYITGNSKGNVHVAGNTVNTGLSGFFLLKLNTAGNTEWLKTASNTSTITPKGISIDDSSNCFLIGDFSNALTLQDTTITTNGATNLFIVKYNEAGNVQWLSKTGNTTAGNLNSHVIATDIAVDKTGKNIYAIARYRGTVFLNTTPLTVSPTDIQYIFFKCTDSAKVQWVKERGVYNDGLNNKIILDTKQSIYLNQNGIIKLDSNGNQLYRNTDVVAYNFITDSLNNLYAIGTQSFAAFVNGMLFTEPSFFAIKYNEFGDLQLIRRNNNFTSVDISIDDSLNMYVSGNFALNLTLNPQIVLVNNSQLLADRDFVIGKINTTNFVEPEIEALENQTNAIGGIFSIVGKNLGLTNNVLVNNTNTIITSIEKNKVSAFILPATTNGSIQLQTSYGSANTNSQLQLLTAQAPNNQQGSKLTGTGISASAKLGSAVAISADGSTAVVGVPDDNNSAGAAIVYVKQQNTWVQQGSKLVGTGIEGTLPGKQGSAVAISADGNTIVVGAPGDIQNVGCVFIFRRMNNTWQQLGNKIQGIGSFGTPGTSGFGSAVSIDAAASTIVVGSPNDNTGRGGIWIVKKSQTGIWSNTTSKLIGSNNINNSNFGSSVSISADGSTILVGGRGHANRGAAWIYKLENTGIYSEDGGIIYNSSLPTGVNFGSAVATDGVGKTMAIAGVGDNSGTGAVWIYEKNTQTNIWTSTIKLTPTSTGVNFGSAIALSLTGNHLVVGSRLQTSNNGSAVIYAKQNNSWNTTPSTLLVNDNSGAANIGTSVALSTNLTTLIVGGNSDNSNAGAAWIFTNSNNTTLPITLNHFSVTKQSNTALLEWASATEINAKHYQIETSFDGTNFAAVAIVNAKGVASSYKFTNALPTNLQNNTTIYYRLKLVDNDGTFSYSVVKALQLTPIAASVHMYPNPVKDVLYIEANNASSLKIYTINGKQIHQQVISNIPNNVVAISNYAKGIYIVQLTYKNGNIVTKQFIKE
jgi:hypothetical protein